jgi:ribonuclease BN (tRNA processing enzyme)
MRVEILGCSGGIGDDRHTTAFLIDDDILLDAGSGALRLSRAALARIDHVFVTHCHLDHILALPLLLDSVAGERSRPLLLHALPEVLEILKDHIFNWRIWPDFSRIPSVKQAFLRYAPISIGQTLALPDASGARREFTPIPAFHVVPTSGYLLRGPLGSLLFTSDTGGHSALWEIAERQPDLRHLLVDCSYANAQKDIAIASRHFYAEELAADLAGLKNCPEVWVAHLKPGAEAEIMRELTAALPLDANFAIRPLPQDQILEI